MVRRKIRTTKSDVRRALQSNGTEEDEILNKGCNHLWMYKGFVAFEEEYVCQRCLMKIGIKSDALFPMTDGKRITIKRDAVEVSD